MSTDLEPLLKRHSLANARRIWRDLVQRAEKEDWPYETLLFTLFSGEIAHRRGTRLTRALGAAALPFLRTIEEYDFTSPLPTPPMNRKTAEFPENRTQNFRNAQARVPTARGEQRLDPNARLRPGVAASDWTTWSVRRPPLATACPAPFRFQRQGKSGSLARLLMMVSWKSAKPSDRDSLIQH